MRHLKCIAASLVVAILVYSVTALGQDTEHVPTLVQGTGLDAGGWILRNYGPAGLAAYLAWQASKMLTSFRGIPLVVEVRVKNEPEKKEP